MELLSPEDFKFVDQAIAEAKTEQLDKHMGCILGLFERKKVSTKMVLDPDWVAIHEDNRDSYGVNGADVLELGDGFDLLGFNPAKLSLICLQLKESQRRQAEEYNARQVKDSRGILPPYIAGIVKFKAVDGTHTNQYFRCIKHGSPHTNERTCTDGRLDKDKIGRKNPELKQHAEEGGLWTVIPDWVAERWPDLPNMLQAAQNSIGQNRKPENDFQLMRRLNRAYHNKIASGKKEVTFADIKQEVLKSKPTNQAAIPHMFTFDLKFGGGRLSNYTQGTEARVKARASSSRRITAERYQALSEDWNGPFQGLHIRHSMLTLMNLSENPDFVSASDVRKLGKKDNIGKTQEAEKLLMEMVDLTDAPEFEAYEEQIRDVAVIFEMRLVSFLVNKKYDKIDFENMRQIAWKMVDDLQITCNVKITDKWDAWSLNDAQASKRGSPKKLKMPVLGKRSLVVS